MIKRKNKIIFSLVVLIVWYIILSVISTPPVCPTGDQCSNRIPSLILNCGCGGDWTNTIFELFFIILPSVIVYGVLSTKRSKAKNKQTAKN